LVTVLLICASPPTVCLTAGVLVLTTGVLVLTTGAGVWAPCLMTGATVLVTGASACPAAGTTDALGFCAVAELPLPPVDWLPALEEPL
jgi:hypothetical protein